MIPRSSAIGYLVYEPEVYFPITSVECVDGEIVWHSVVETEMGEVITMDLAGAVMLVGVDYQIVWKRGRHGPEELHTAGHGGVFTVSQPERRVETCP